MRSGLTRGFDPRLPSNRFVLLMTPVAGIVAGVVTLAVGDGLGVAVQAGFGAGGAGFLAWATTRELHPDRPVLAAVALLLAPWGLLVTRPDLLAAGVGLVVARIVAGTTGRGIQWVDVAWVGTLALVATWRPAAAPVLAVGAVAVLAVAVVSARRRGETAALGMMIAAAAALGPVLADVTIDPVIDALSITGVALGVVALLGPRSVRVGTDRVGGTITPGRVRAARAVVLVSAALGALVVAPATLAPLWASLAGVALRPGAPAAGSQDPEIRSHSRMA